MRTAGTSAAVLTFGALLTPAAEPAEKLDLPPRVILTSHRKADSPSLGTLGDPAFRLRERATIAAVSEGAHMLPLLAKLHADTGNEEVRSRCESARAAIVRNTRAGIEQEIYKTSCVNVASIKVASAPRGGPYISSIISLRSSTSLRVARIDDHLEYRVVDVMTELPTRAYIDQGSMPVGGNRVQTHYRRLLFCGFQHQNPIVVGELGLQLALPAQEVELSDARSFYAPECHLAFAISDRMDNPKVKSGSIILYCQDSLGAAEAPPSFSVVVGGREIQAHELPPGGKPNAYRLDFGEAGPFPIRIRIHERNPLFKIGFKCPVWNPLSATDS